MLTNSPTNHTIDIAEVERAEERLRQAMLTNDLAELDNLLSERLMFVGPGGQLADKASDIEARRTGLVKMSVIIPLEQRIEQFGSVIVVNAKMEIKGSLDDAEFFGQFRYTRVWHDEGDQLRIVAGSVIQVR
jgi:ketosteroid isomerase-like protein